MTRLEELRKKYPEDAMPKRDDFPFLYSINRRRYNNGNRAHFSPRAGFSNRWEDYEFQPSHPSLPNDGNFIVRGQYHRGLAATR